MRLEAIAIRTQVDRLNSNWTISSDSGNFPGRLSIKFCRVCAQQVENYDNPILLRLDILQGGH
jgi:hypothetical protein